MNFNLQGCFTKKRFSRKICYNQKTWIFIIRSWIEKETDITKQRYQGLDKVYEFDLEDEGKKKRRIKRIKNQI